MTEYLIALGANKPTSKDDLTSTLERTIRLLNDQDDVDVIRVSRWYDTPAWPAGSGPDFVNGAAVLRSDLAPEHILQCLHMVEAILGRSRHTRWEPRVCDLDLIGAGSLVAPDAATVRRFMAMSAEKARHEIPDQLILPHPRMHERAFVVVPLQDVAPDWVHPILQKSVVELVANLSRKARDEVRRRK